MNCKAGLGFLTRTFGVCCYFNVSNSTLSLLFSTIAFTTQNLQNSIRSLKGKVFVVFFFLFLPLMFWGRHGVCDICPLL